MIIKNATRDEIYIALNEVNEVFDNNVRFNRFDVLNKRDTRFAITLKVADCRGKGARRGFPIFKGFDKAPDWEKRRHIPFACWHVHGTFFDSLPLDTEIRVKGEGLHRPKDPWLDRNIGTDMFPYYFSEACDC